MTATEKAARPACAGAAKYGAQAAGRKRRTRVAARACHEGAAAVETFKTATARRMTDGTLTGCEATIAACDRAFAGGGIK